MMFREFIGVEPVLILGFAKQPSTCISMGGADCHVTGIDLIEL